MLPIYSIVIPTYGAKGVELLNNLLPCISYSCHLAHETIVVDDGTTDEQALDQLVALCRMSNVALLHTDENGGFAKAVNAGIAQSNGDIVILCNNDIIPIGSTFDFLAEEAIHMNSGVMGCKLLYGDNRIQHAGVLYVPDRTKAGDKPGHGWFDHYLRFEPRHHLMATQLVPRLCTGALLACSFNLFNVIGMLDERFGMACEDIDLNMRAMEAGFRVFYNGHIEAYHLEGQTRGATPEVKAQHPEWTAAEAKALEFMFEKWAGVTWDQFTVRDTA